MARGSPRPPTREMTTARRVAQLVGQAGDRSPSASPTASARAVDRDRTPAPCAARPRARRDVAATRRRPRRSGRPRSPRRRPTARPALPGRAKSGCPRRGRARSALPSSRSPAALTAAARLPAAPGTRRPAGPESAHPPDQARQHHDRHRSQASARRHARPKPAVPAADLAAGGGAGDVRRRRVGASPGSGSDIIDRAGRGRRRQPAERPARSR